MDLLEEGGSDENKTKASDERALPRTRSPRRCAVCGDSPAKIHYGVFACFGCKGFFRRAVKDGCNRYVCRYDRKCNVDKYERNSCRYCRFRRCLQVGMNPQSVRPDRDQTGKQRIARLTKTQRKIISPIMIADGDSSIQSPVWNDWTKHLSIDLRKILMDLINLDMEIHKTASSVTDEAITGFSLRSLVAERSIQERKVSHSSTQTSSLGVEDLSATSLWRLIEIIDWIDGVCRLAESRNERKVITTDDKVTILQNCFSQQIIFTLSAKTAMNSTTSDIFCIYDCMGNRSDKSKRDLVDRIVTEFVSPLRRLTPSDAELVIFRAIVTMNPDMLGLNATVKKILADSRDIFQELLFKSLKKSRSKVTFSSAQFGNYLLLLPNFYALSECLRESLRCRYESGTLLGCSQLDSYKLILGEVLNHCGTELMDATQISTETCDTFDQECEHFNRLPNIVQTMVDAFAISSRGISEFADMMLLGNTSLHYENKAASQLTDICNETECNINGNILLSNGLNLPSFEQEHPETLKMMAKLLNDSAMVTNEGKRVFRALKSRNSATKIFDRNIPVASIGAITALHVVVSSLAFVVAFLLV